MPIYLMSIRVLLSVEFCFALKIYLKGAPFYNASASRTSTENRSGEKTTRRKRSPRSPFLDNFRIDDPGLVPRTRLKWSPTHPWQHHALAPILSVCCRTRRLSSCGAQVDCQWSSYVTANRTVSSASAPRKVLLEYLPNGAGRPPEIHRHNLGTESGWARGNPGKLLYRPAG